ncbi:MAG: DNA methylase, partial [Bacillota bacterium]
MDRLISYCSSLGYWHVSGEKMSPSMQRQALAMVWDYAELNPSSGATGDWNSALDWVLRVVDHCSRIQSLPATVAQASATALPYPDNYFDAVVTDPPYYNSVPYADLSDFFYVWLKRAAAHLHPELFATPLAPKADEIGEMSGWDPRRYAHKDKAFFEEAISRAFQEISRVLKPNGPAVIVFAHSSTDAWETIINAILNSGLYLTSSWPLHTEMKAR